MLRIQASLMLLNDTIDEQHAVCGFADPRLVAIEKALAEYVKELDTLECYDPEFGKTDISGAL